MNSFTALSDFFTLQKALYVIATSLELTSYLWPQQACISDGMTFDFIVVGAGSAGSVIANRLTENKNVNVLLIEAGGDPPIESMLPSQSGVLIKSSYDWNTASDDDRYTEQCSKFKTHELIRGKLLGGSSSINYMLYTRGYPYEYKKWVEAANDTVWDWDNILRYYKKSEKLVDPVVSDSPYGLYHGKDGYMGVKRYHYEDTNKHLEAFRELGFNIPLDINNGTLGYTAPMFTIADGVRQSTALAFLHTILNRTNLFVLKNTKVTKILFDCTNTAYGVQVLMENENTCEINARKEVIISAGAVNSAHLLLLSGIGPEEHLRSKNVPVIADLPVGKNYQNHVGTVLVYTLSNNNKTQRPSDPHEISTPVYIGLVAVDDNQSHPDYETLGIVYNKPASYLTNCNINPQFESSICDYIYRNSKDKILVYVTHKTLYPKSRGEILLRSNDPQDSPRVLTGYYSDERDVENQMRFVRHYIPIINSTYYKESEAVFLNPAFRKCGELDFESDDFLRCYILCMMASGQHYCGTCAMGSVVDSRLRVFNVHRLRVADAGVMPYITGAHTNAPAIMIGEMAADMIKEDHCL